MIDKLEAERIEKVLVGTFLLNHDALPEHAGQLRPEEFRLDSHRHLWTTMLTANPLEEVCSSSWLI